MDCRREVEELHAFFVDWFHGRLTEDDGTWGRFEAALAPSFLLVSPDGAATARSELAARLRELHGSRPEGRFRIWIEEFVERHHEGPLCLVTYVECQELDDGQQTRRRSTALFHADPEAPCGCRWLHVHETWLEGHAPSP
jgi:hypothetical protein